ncbi:3-keto-5-aminohexanoate cleavage protein [Terasakiella sp. A23]|uniref:3-keto-5-aminohexanoate cleavage protein n=1 Tax=Terasakiella sp. FCG-A23 TaxID=3080561 RepID=UPI002955852A|nr:3-keto-5-aminohexanoate cleavage protein [Terasakiella sp. A23]MDV7338957.1 3-keto-5-aminohexanoate cleavage protein [Terasakiella sp. A23]
MNENMLFTVAPNGARLTKKDHPALPISPQELSYCAAQCLEAGAGMIHLHVRDHLDKHVLDAGLYRDAIEAIKQDLGNRIVVQITTEAVGVYQADEQMAVVRAVNPEAVSLGLRELMPENGDEKAFAAFCEWMSTERIWPQFILYDAYDMRRLIDLQARGLIPFDKLAVLFVLGRYGKQQANPKELLSFLSVYEEGIDWDWSVCAFGDRENACISAAACLGGHGRIGYENNRKLADGTISKDNAELIDQAVYTAKLIGRKPMNAEEVRARYGLRQ